MEITLSNCEVLAYRRRSGGWSLHLKTAVITDVGWNFDTSHVERLAAHVVFPNRRRRQFDCRLHVDAEYAFDNGLNAITVDLTTVHEEWDIEQCIVTIEMDVHFDFGGTMYQVCHRQRGVLRRMIDGTSANRHHTMG